MLSAAHDTIDSNIGGSIMFEELGFSQSEKDAILEKFDDDFIRAVIENKQLVLENYQIFQKYNFTDINEIACYYLPIINDSKYLETRLKLLIAELGEDYLTRIGENMDLLEVLL